MKLTPRHFLYTSLAITSLLALEACKGGPEQKDITPLAGPVHQQAAEEGILIGLKQVKVLKVTPGERYQYAEVREGDKTYWLASPKQELRAGETYYYNEALVRTQFESTDLQQVFDTLLLVTRLVPEGEQDALKAPLHKAHPGGLAGEVPAANQGTAPVSLELPELLQNPQAYENRWVEFSGTCVKVNEGIMGRNWVHLKALGEATGEVVLTTQETIAVGQVVRMQAVVRLNRDFGSGYKYDLLLEEGQKIR